MRRYKPEEFAALRLSADVVVTPVIEQLIMGAYPLVAGQRQAAELARALRAKVLVPMNNGDIDLGGSRLPLDVRACVCACCMSGGWLVGRTPKGRKAPPTQQTELISPLHTHTHTLKRMIKKSGTLEEFRRILAEVYPSALVKETPVGQPVTV